MYDYVRELVENYYELPNQNNSHYWIKVKNDAPMILSKATEHQKDQLLRLYIEYMNRDIGYDSFADTMDKLIVMLADRNDDSKKEYADSIRNGLYLDCIEEIAEIIEEVCDENHNILLEQQNNMTHDQRYADDEELR